MNNETPMAQGPVDVNVRPLTDAQLLRWLRDKLDWDGYGYWLPEICIKETGLGNDKCPEPTMAEFRSALSERARAA